MLTIPTQLVWFYAHFFRLNPCPCRLVSCAPTGVEKESGRQLDFDNDFPNEIPSDVVPVIPRGNGSPGYPGRRSTGGLLNTIMNFFRSVLGLGSNTDATGLGAPDSSDGQTGIMGFIRRTFGRLINTVMAMFGGVGANSDPAVDFPLRRPRQEPLRASHQWVEIWFNGILCLYYILSAFICHQNLWQCYCETINGVMHWSILRLKSGLKSLN